MKIKLYTPEVKSLGDRKMRFTISTGAVDRDGDMIDPKGWDLKPFLSNPVVLWGHDYSQPPVGKATNVWSDPQGLHAEVQFTPIGMNPFADMIHDMCKGGFLNATSVGFRVGESIPNGTGGYLIKQAELLEFSIVSIPSNPQALIQQRGLNTAALRKWFDVDGGRIDWDAIACSTPEVDLGALLSTKADAVEVDISPDDVRRCMETLLPALRDGLRTGIKLQAEMATTAAMNYMRGRLD